MKDDIEKNRITQLFNEHVFDNKIRDEVIRNNYLIDLYFHSGKDEFKEIEKIIFDKYGIESDNVNNENIENLKKNSLLMTILFLRGICDADCDICYTDRMSHEDNELSIEELKHLIDQVAALGNKTIYIPGEGEPFSYPFLKELIDYALEKEQNVVLFSNGLLLSDEKEFKKKFKISVDSFLDEYVANNNVFIYFKYWNSNAGEQSRHMWRSNANKCREKYSYEEFIIGENKTIHIPKILKKALDKGLNDKVGIETAVFSENYNDIITNIMLFVKEQNIKWYLEPILHSGRYFNRHDLDLTHSQESEISEYYNIEQQCKRAMYSITITSNGFLTYCPTFFSIPNVKGNKDYIASFNLRDNDSRLKSIFNMIHNVGGILPSLLNQRYASLYNKCLCELYSKELEQYTHLEVDSYAPDDISIIPEIGSPDLISQLINFMEDELLYHNVISLKNFKQKLKVRNIAKRK